MAGEPGVPGLRLRAPIPVERGNMLLFRRSSCLELLLMDRIVHYARLRGLVPDRCAGVGRGAGQPSPRRSRRASCRASTRSRGRTVRRRMRYALRWRTGCPARVRLSWPPSPLPPARNPIFTGLVPRGRCSTPGLRRICMTRSPPAPRAHAPRGCVPRGCVPAGRGAGSGGACVGQEDVGPAPAGHQGAVARERARGADGRRPRGCCCCAACPTRAAGPDHARDAGLGCRGGVGGAGCFSSLRGQH